LELRPAISHNADKDVEIEDPKCPPARPDHARSHSVVNKSAGKGQELPHLRVGGRQRPKLRATVGFTLIELLVVVVILGILATIGTNVIGAREKAYLAVMKADLKNLASEQELHVVNNYEYANIITDLPFTLSEGITMELLGETGGFTARTTHLGLPSARCAIFIGTVSSIYSPATVSGAMSCDGAGAGGGGNGNGNANGNANGNGNSANGNANNANGNANNANGNANGNGNG